MVPLAEPKQEANQFILDEDTQKKMKTRLTQTMIPLKRRTKKAMKKIRSMKTGSLYALLFIQRKSGSSWLLSPVWPSFLKNVGFDCGSPCMSSLNFTRELW